ncbi:DUF3987 domain-containing protein [Hyphomicrobium sp. D-2]|uniref:DUF3987 domain-containing protein n=1 Tax=Hyphomicrobium sp. D-2 TaxID=3041621 RepID=UPI0024579580|nr:DUF3987 domain-containing protein [Hyphomicrobium sp. D-2]MDH4981457.1 DUF3987 domain-containing protein [Hyphomicrobium sp. D-2]
MLSENSRGLLVFCDELSGLVGSFDAYKAQGVKKDRAAMLELHNGGPRRVDRKSSGNTLVPNWGVSLMGGIQPDKLQAMASGLVDDGFLQRALLYEGRQTGKRLDRLPDAAALEAYRVLIGRLAAINEMSSPGCVVMHEDAHQHRERVDMLVEAFKSMPTTPAALKQHFSKWPGLFARLVLTLHAVETVDAVGGVGAVVSEGTAKRAADLMLCFFLPNALTIYQQFFGGSNPRADHARWVGDHILAHGLASITARDVCRAYGKLSKDEKALKLTMADLQAANWLGEPDYSHRGSVRWAVNPGVHAIFAERARVEGHRREAVKRKILESREVIKQALN